MKRLAIGGVLAASVVVGAALSRGWADGIAPSPMYYGGVIEQDGARVEGARDMEIELWDDAVEVDASHRACATRRDGVSVEDGAFRIELDRGCVDAVQSNPDLWVELRVDGESLGRSKLGAVPYAVEAARAADASGPLRERLDAMVPSGTIVAYGGERAPAGWLACDGAELARAEHPALFAALGTAHGEGDGATTFRLPDYRGRFLRGVDAGRGLDPDAGGRGAPAPGGNEGDLVGSVQDFATARPITPFSAGTAGSHSHQVRGEFWTGVDDFGEWGVAQQNIAWQQTGTAGEHTHPIDGGDAETRPRNAGVIWIIKD